METVCPPLIEAAIGVLKGAFLTAKKHINYLTNSEKNFACIATEIQELEKSEAEVQQWVNDHEYMGKTVKTQVTTWLHSTKGVKDRVGSVMNEYNVEKDRRLCGPVPNYYHIYKLGKKAAHELKELDEHKGKTPTDWDAVTGPPRVVRRLRMRSVPLDGQLVAPATLERIMSCVRSPEFQRIGVYGMGGVGKTTLMEHLNNEAEDFDYVFFIRASKDPNYKSIRKSIAEMLYLSLPEHEDEVRAQQLIFDRLKQPWMRSLLILDDVWPGFAFQELGVPDRSSTAASTNRCKIVVVSRSVEVLNFMLTDVNVRVEFMSRDDAQILFLSLVGKKVMEDPVIVNTANKVLTECGRLPLAITVVGKSMRNQERPELWSNALRALQKSTGDDIDIPGIDSQVYRSLRYSFDCLDPAIKTCFLYFSLFPEDEIIFTYFLTFNWYLEGLMPSEDNFRDVDQRGSTIIARLEEAGLLQRGDYARNVTMHDLIRDMAIRIAETTAELRCLTMTGSSVVAAPQEEGWRSAKRISLMGTSIRTLPDRPDCPQLLTLLLEGNRKLQVIPNCFFERMQALQVLNLSRTNIQSLPSSLSSLQKLRALYFYSCKMLVDISPVKDLPDLQVLDLYLTIVTELPKGFENLLNLRLLRMGFTANLAKIPQNLFLQMTRLQVLNMYRSYGYWAVLGANNQAQELSGSTQEWMNLKDLENMTSLKTLEITINERVESLEWLLTSSLGDRIEGLAIQSCRNFRAIQSALAQKASNLRALTLRSCFEVGEIINGDDKEAIIFPNLRLLQLEELPLLQNIWLIAKAHIDYGRLEKLTISDCPLLVNLFTPELLEKLVYLNYFDVSKCPRMQRIIEGAVGAEQVSVLRRMTSFRIADMVGLSSIYDGLINMPSLRKVEVNNCPLLKKLPFDLKHSVNITDIVGETQWIEALELDDVTRRKLFPAKQSGA